MFNIEDEKEKNQEKLSVKGAQDAPKAPKEEPKPIKVEEVSPIDTDDRVAKYEKDLYELRKDGSAKIVLLKDDIYDTKHNKMIDPKTRKIRLARDYAELEKAKQVAERNKPAIAKIVEEAKVYVKELGKADYQKQKGIGQAKVEKAKQIWEQTKPGIDAKHETAVKKLEADFNQKSLEVQKANEQALAAAKNDEERKLAQEENKSRSTSLKDDYKGEISSEKVAYKTELKDERIKYEKVVQNAKDLKHQAYLAQYNKVLALKGGKVSLSDNVIHKYEGRIYNFNWVNFILNNALYIVIILFFLACIIITPIKYGFPLLTLSNIVALIDNAAPRIFFALGVGGLILLGGTDLSIGRIIGIGTFIVGFIMHSSDSGKQATHFFDLKNNVPGSTGGKIVLAFVLCVAVCVFFCAIAGFFSARFKMHPFITTLSTMMIIYGIMMVATAGVPTGPVDTELASKIVGHIGTNPGFPIYLIYAIVAIIICWFIWNKTKFGKDIYAVGGNPEAAAVSGISYFKVTFGVFLLAGVFYGIGCFLYGFSSNPAANNGYGYELDAISACVVGGISFFGGIGKVKGAVIGVLIFSGLSTVLNIMGVSSYYQFVIKGLILMAAVALDSVKYLKKK